MDPLVKVDPSTGRKTVKAIILGPLACGKSCFLLRLVDNKFREAHELTIGVEFGSVLFENLNTKLQLWDTAGQESFRSITRAYYAGSSIVIAVFDVRKAESFQQCKQFIQEFINMKKDGQRFEGLLVGNKSDSPNREVSVDEATQYALSINFFYLDFSCKANTKEEGLSKLEEVLVKFLA